MDNLRSQPCPECGASMIWTHNAWKTGDTGLSAYSCENGHVIDPTETRQCPVCGVHDTVAVGEQDGVQQLRCDACGTSFEFPR